MDDELTELYDAEIPRVDLVLSAANGTKFLIAKDAAPGGGLVDADTVRELIGKTADAPAPEQVTLSGSPAAIMRMIHHSAVTKTSSGTTDEVSKELDVSDADNLDASVAMAEPEDKLPGSETDPGSPAWEAVDAATACKWTAILARAKAAIELLGQREMLEAASGADPDDADNAYGLNDACCAIDYAIGVLAPYAVAEHTDAEVASDMEALGKALDGYDPAGLDTIEVVLGQVVKAGRVLSTANEAAIRGAVEQLQKVLASLPAAPIADEPVTKQTQEGDVPEDTATKTTDARTEAAPETDVTKAGETDAALTVVVDPGTVTKADGEGKTPAVAVYDAKGNLVGIVDPADVTPISGADKADGGDEVVPATEGDGTPEGAQTETSDLAPAPPAAVGTAADDVVKSGEPSDTETTDESDTSSDVLKSIAEDVVKQLDGRFAKQEEFLAKQVEALTQATDTIETLKGQVKALEEQPAESKIFANGAVPPAPVLRGQDRGAPPIDVAKAAELRQSLYKSHDATEQNRIAAEMNAGAIDALQAIHQRRASQ